jgi:universal stress protein E
VAKLGSAVVLRRVLAASDLSPTGERVIGYAAFVAARFGAALHVVHAFQLERDERMRRLAEQLARAEPVPKAELHVLRATPSQAVLDCCARVEPDLVVMGTLSHGGLGGRLVGSTAERLLGRLDVSLLTLKPEDFVCPVAIDA